MPAASREIGTLTKRELEVVQLLAHGYEPSQIAARLGVTRNQIQGLIYGARKHLMADTTPHIVYLALKKGLIH